MRLCAFLILRWLLSDPLRQTLAQSRGKSAAAPHFLPVLHVLHGYSHPTPTHHSNYFSKAAHHRAKFWYNGRGMDEILTGDTAFLTNKENYSFFSFGGDVIRFATPSRLRRYARVKKWDDGYLEVDADYGSGEVEDYIDIRQILENLYYDADAFLKRIKKVEVLHA